MASRPKYLVSYHITIEIITANAIVKATGTI